MDSIGTFFVSLLALSTLASIMSEGIAKIVLQLFKYAIEGWKASVLALVSSFVAVGIGAFANLGMFGIEDFSPFSDLVTTGIMGVGIWIAAKGVFSFEVLQSILSFLKIKVPKAM